MAKFQYKAKKKNAETVFGQIEAQDKNEAIDKVNRLGLLPISVEETSLIAAYKGQVHTKRVRSKEVLMFSKQLVSLLKAGMPILRSLEIITAQMRNPYFQYVIESLRLSVRGGKSFSDALMEYPHIFSTLYVTMVKIGEESGKLTESIIEIAEYQRRQEEIRLRLKNAMAYPVFMASFGLMTLGFLLIYVMPKIKGLFVNFNQNLPSITEFTLRLSAGFSDWRVLSGLVIIGFAGSLSATKFFSSSEGRLFLSRLQVSIPFLSQFFVKIEMSRFSRTLELLLKSGVPIVRALQLTLPMIQNVIVKEQLQKCLDELLAGRSFGVSLKHSPHIPPLMGHLIIVAEAGGTLVETLHDMAEEYDDETYESIKTMMTFFEPVMILLVGSIIGFFVISLLLPVFDLNVFSG